MSLRPISICSDDRGVDFFLANAGTDFATLVDAFARREAEGKLAPRVPWWSRTSSVAVGMAHGAWARHRTPPGGDGPRDGGHGERGLRASSRRRAREVPILMSAGRTPITEEGPPGTRDLYIHWAQESFDQARHAPRVREVGLRAARPSQVEAVVDRAFEMMLSEPRGPVYLTLPREVLAAPLPGRIDIASPARRQVAGCGSRIPLAVEEAAAPSRPCQLSAHPGLGGRARSRGGARAGGARGRGRHRRRRGGSEPT